MLALMLLPPLARFLACLLVLSSSLGCGDDPPEEPAIEPPPPPLRERASLMGPRSLATPASFDMFLTRRGAVLAIGAPLRDGGEIQGILLGADGEVTGERVLVEGQTGLSSAAVELAADAADGRMGLVWVRYDGTEHRARGILLDTEEFRPGEVRDLGEVTPRRQGAARGGIEIAASSASITAIVPAVDGPCQERSEGAAGDPGPSCKRFRVRALYPAERAEREGIGLAIPETCERPLSGFVHTGDTWFYGLCAQNDGRPESTLYGIRFDPRYASADTAFEDCAPVGLAGFGNDRVFMSADCEGGRKGAWFMDAGTRHSEIFDEPTLSCERETLTIVAGDVRISLNEPLDRIGALLPAAIAPPGSRALFTGQVLLVANATGASVSLARHECIDGRVLRTDAM